MAFKTASKITGVSDATRAAQAAAEAAAKKNSAVGEKEVHETLGSKALPAKYKIEVYFGPQRTLNGPNTITLTFWESGRRLHGGGDDLMFICRDVKDEALGCGHIFSSDCVKGPFAICPKCERAVSAERCSRFLTGRKTTKTIAAALAKFWHQLEGNADIYLKFDRTDIRYVAIEKSIGSKKARELKGLSIYPLKNIIADTAHGADLVQKFYAFLTA
jgi:hypothetical protein